MLSLNEYKREKQQMLTLREKPACWYKFWNMGPGLNISTNIGWVAMELLTETHGLLIMYADDAWDPLTVP